MSLTKTSVIDKIEVLENNVIQVRQRNDILDNGVVISSLFHRWTLEPGRDLSDQDPRVAAVAQSIWTPDVIAAYEASQKVE